jgi:hypothetical protein
MSFPSTQTRRKHLLSEHKKEETSSHFDTLFISMDVRNSDLLLKTKQSPTVVEKNADSGARHMDMSENELLEHEKVQSEDEGKIWEQPLELYPAPVKPPPKRGKHNKVPVRSDVSDLWPKYSDSADRKQRGYTGEYGRSHTSDRETTTSYRDRKLLVAPTRSRFILRENVCSTVLGEVAFLTGT